MKTLFLYIVIIFFVSGGSFLFAQHNNLQQSVNNGNKVKIQKIIFNDIESGIASNDVKKFSQYFSSQPYISLVNGVNG
ncbi:MAG: hypothetical protein IH618_05435, partial [Ignavibacteriaceae bacterium]|nr:hypothetical protein [Ignavibacteriaceae bacterium]